MRASAVAGIVFANTNDNLLKDLTSDRSMASVPFGARYRLIDFSLSNLVNAGVTNVGIITKENYRSLMDHVGNGISWELDRKNGGVYFLPPYLTKGVGRYSGTVDTLYAARNYIERCSSDYMILCNADVLANVDISSALSYHLEKEADITIIYHNDIKIDDSRENMLLSMSADGRVTDIEFSDDDKKPCDIGIVIIGRKLLKELVKTAYENDLVSFNADVIAKKVKQLKIFGFEHKEYVCYMNGTDSYYKASMELLNPEIRRQVFHKSRPILTKTRDDMPSRYGVKADVKNSLLGDGCVIEGTVKNSILFRGVKVKKGAVVENCILMQETVVGENSELSNVIADKNAVIGDNMVLKGTAQNHFLVKKNQII